MTENCEVDSKTAKKIKWLCGELGVNHVEVVRRAIDILAMARVIRKGHEVDEKLRDDSDGND